MLRLAEVQREPGPLAIRHPSPLPKQLVPLTPCEFRKRVVRMTGDKQVIGVHRALSPCRIEFLRYCDVAVSGRRYRR